MGTPCLVERDGARRGAGQRCGQGSEQRNGPKMIETGDLKNPMEAWS